MQGHKDVAYLIGSIFLSISTYPLRICFGHSSASRITLCFFTYFNSQTILPYAIKRKNYIILKSAAILSKIPTELYRGTEILFLRWLVKKGALL